jgi:hypothetical protein
MGRRGGRRRAVRGAVCCACVVRTSDLLRGFADMIWVWRLLPEESLQERGRVQPDSRPGPL